MAMHGSLQRLLRDGLVGICTPFTRYRFHQIITVHVRHRGIILVAIKPDELEWSTRVPRTHTQLECLWFHFDGEASILYGLVWFTCMIHCAYILCQVSERNGWRTHHLGWIIPYHVGLPCHVVLVDENRMRNYHRHHIQLFPYPSAASPNPALRLPTVPKPCVTAYSPPIEL